MRLFHLILSFSVNIYTDLDPLSIFHGFFIKLLRRRYENIAIRIRLGCQAPRYKNNNRCNKCK